MDCLEGVHEMQEVWIIEKMLPERAADIMIHIGTETAARKLLVRQICCMHVVSFNWICECNIVHPVTCSSWMI